VKFRDHPHHLVTRRGFGGAVARANLIDLDAGQDEWLLLPAGSGDLPGQLGQAGVANVGAGHLVGGGVLPLPR